MNKNRFKLNKNIVKGNKGFTLIEIMIATVVFLLIMVAAIGALVTTSNAAKNSKALRSAMDNVNYAMDNISRSLRLGSLYNCGSNITLPTSSTSDCLSGASEIAFMASGSTTQNTSFRLNSSSGSIERCEGKRTPECLTLTSDDVEITDLEFYTRGSNVSDSSQPSVLIFIKGEVTINGEVTEFALQNYVSQRNAE